MASGNKKSEQAQPGGNGLGAIFRRGDFFTKLSFGVFGAANIAHKQIIKGLIFLAIEAAYIYYMVSKTSST